MTCFTKPEMLDLLDGIQLRDRAAEDPNSAATICACCRTNTHVGRYPFWHRYSRKLCSDCGDAYTQFLKTLGAWE